MNRIRVLPEILANKIAAGEIVERPASVVKELVENSIDAGCRSVEVSAQAGGKRLILVRDDGEGMTQDDAILAFEHHATSKLLDAEGLNAIATLGFRGEALPSIASVSRLTLRTKQADSGSVAGTELEIHGGVMRSVKPLSWDRGTEIAVRDLFYNIPARRKFLRSHETEMSHIARLVTHYALAQPEIRFKLESDGRTLMDAAAAKDGRQRVFQVFGEGFLDRMIEVSAERGELKVRGFVSLPSEQRTNAYSQFFYVNRRMVRDKVIMSAVRQAYRTRLPGSAYPVAILFLELPFEEVDVNAHPAKTEIRFRDQGAVHELIRDTIDQALARNVAIPSYRHADASQASYVAASDALGDALGDVPGPQRIASGAGAFDFVPVPASTSPLERTLDYSFREAFRAAPMLANAASHHLPDHASDRASDSADHSMLRLLPHLLFGAQPEAVRPFAAGGVRILGQFRESYIVACDAAGLLLIDQHVAHERILYEKMAAAMRERTVESQGRLVPLSLELAPHQMAILGTIMPELTRNGFELELFGGNAVLVRGVPAAAGEADCLKLLVEILDGIDREERTLDVERIRDRIAVSSACRAAIKVNMPLTMEKMQWLLDELASTRVPTNCPHGRPVLLRFSMYEIEKNFGRI